MSDPGELSPSTSPASSPQPGYANRRQQQDVARPATPSPGREPQAVNPNAAPSKHWTDGQTAASRYVAAEEARRAERDGATDPPSGDQPRESATDGAKYKVGDLELTSEEVRGLMERHALEESRKATLPADPSGYDLTLPADFQTPQGVEFRWATDDPVLGPMIDQAKRFAHEAGLSQDQFSKMMSLYAGSETARLVRINDAVKAEIDKLGATATPRVSAIQTWVRGVIGDDALTGAVMSGIRSAAAVKGWEKILDHNRSQGGGSYSHAHRQPPAASGEIPGYEQMTFLEKRAAQDAQRRGR